jgi:hypothetical protein
MSEIKYSFAQEAGAEEMDAELPLLLPLPLLLLLLLLALVLLPPEELPLLDQLVLLPLKSNNKIWQKCSTC